MNMDFFLGFMAGWLFWKLDATYGARIGAWLADMTKSLF